MATDGRMTESQRREILRRAELVQRAEAISDYCLAGALGCSRPTLSLVKAGRYTGDTDRYVRKIQQWLIARAERAAPRGAAWADTTIGRRMRAVCDRARSVPCMGRIVAPAGTGKTVTLREYVRTGGDNCLLIQAGVALRTPKGVLGEIAARLSIRVAGVWELARLYREVREEIARRYAAGKGDIVLLLVDESVTLSGDAIECLRNLHDDPQCRAAVVLADTWRIEAAPARSVPAGQEQLRSRFGATYALRPQEQIDLADVGKVVRSILDAVGHQEQVRPDALKLLARLAQQPGRLRNVEQRIYAVRDVADACGIAAQYSYGQLDWVADMVGAEREHRDAASPFAAPAKGQPTTKPVRLVAG